MKQVLISIISGFGAVAAMIAVKMLELPGVITAVLILAVLILAIFALAGGFTTKRTKTEEST